MNDTDNQNPEFQEDPDPALARSGLADASLFTVDVKGFEGPIDLLLTMAREQKVDLVQISIVPLADQYLAFVAEARRANLELAADYLVMAAWLAYLKSRLLLPDLGAEEEPTGEEMAAALQFQLQRLESMQNAGAKLMARERLGIDFFSRGDPEQFVTIVNTIVDTSLQDLLKAYGAIRTRKSKPTVLRIENFDLYTVDDAVSRLRSLLGAGVPDWQTLWQFLPEQLKGGMLARSAVASTFAASLELAKQGQVSIRQDEAFGAIYFRAASAAPKTSSPVSDNIEGTDRDTNQ